MVKVIRHAGEREADNPFWVVRLRSLGLGLLITVMVYLAIAALAFSAPLWLPYVVPQAGQLDPHSEVWTILSHIGAAFAAAAVLMFTFEWRKEAQSLRELGEALDAVRDEARVALDRMHDASIDQVLAVLVGDKRVLLEITRHLIRQDFMYRRFKVDINLEWHDESARQLLLKTHKVNYVVANLTASELLFRTRVYEECESEDLFPGCTKITEFAVSDVDATGAPRNELSRELEKDLEPYVERTADFVTLSREFVIPAGEERWVEVTVEALNKPEYIYSFSLTRIADGLQVDVTHPPDLEIRAFAKHPAKEKFRPGSQKKGAKHWELTAGILPYQGIELHWNPKHGPNSPKQSRVSRKS